MDKLIKILIFHGIIHSKEDVEVSIHNDVSYIFYKIKLTNNEFIYMYSDLDSKKLIRTKHESFFFDNPLSSGDLSLFVQNKIFTKYKFISFQYLFSINSENNTIFYYIKKLLHKIHKKDILFVKYSNLNLLSFQKWFKVYNKHNFLLFPSIFNCYNDYFFYNFQENNVQLIFSFRMRYLKYNNLDIVFHKNYEYEFTYKDRILNKVLVSFKGNLLEDSFDDSFNYFIKKIYNYEHKKIDFKPLVSELLYNREINYNIEVSLLLDRMKSFDLDSILEERDFFKLSRIIKNYLDEISQIGIEINNIKFLLNKHENLDSTLIHITNKNINQLEKVYNFFQKDYEKIREHFLKESDKYSFLPTSIRRLKKSS